MPTGGKFCLILRLPLHVGGDRSREHALSPVCERQRRVNTFLIVLKCVYRARSPSSEYSPLCAPEVSPWSCIKFLMLMDVPLHLNCCIPAKAYESLINSYPNPSTRFAYLTPFMALEQPARHFGERAKQRRSGSAPVGSSSLEKLIFSIVGSTTNHTQKRICCDGQ